MTGFWEGGPQLVTMCNIAEYNKLPKDYQNILEAACWEANTYMVAKYDAQNRLIRSVTNSRHVSSWSR